MHVDNQFRCSRNTASRERATTTTIAPLSWPSSGQGVSIGFLRGNANLFHTRKSIRSCYLSTRTYLSNGNLVSSDLRTISFYFPKDYKFERGQRNTRIGSKMNEGQNYLILKIVLILKKHFYQQRFDFTLICHG